MIAKEFARQLGIESCIEFSPETIVPEERIRSYCIENKCGNYGQNYMCPPYTGLPNEIKGKLRKFRHGLILQYSKDMDIRANREAVTKTKIDFHNKILQMEQFLKKQGIGQLWGLIAGNCQLCTVCKAQSNEPCPHPDRARMSLESIAIDVLGLLERCSLDSKFHDDKIVWTGCVLF